MSLADHDWRLYYPPGTDRAGMVHEGADLTFGRLTANGEGRRIFTLVEPDVQLGDMTTADAQLPEEDARRFGVDFTSPTLVSFELGVDTVDTTTIAPTQFPQETPSISDTFSRSASNGWDAADVGGVWVVEGGTASNFSVTSGFAQIVLTTVAAQVIRIPSPDPDVEVRSDFAFSALPTGAGYVITLLAREVAATDTYLLRVDVGTAGTMTVSIRKRVAGSDVVIASTVTSLPVAADSWYRMLLQIEGSSLRAKVWQAADPEPAVWLLVGTDTTFTAAGYVGVRVFPGAGNTNVNPEIRFDEFYVRTRASAPVNAKGLSNLDAVGALRAAWRADAVRTRPGQVAELHRGHSGRTRVMYGRPRRFAIAGSQHTRKGYTSVVCDFQGADDLFYDTDEQVARVDLTSQVEGGLLSPLTAPLSTTALTSSQTSITVGGNAPTWLIVEFWGPTSSPYLEVLGRFNVGMRTSFAPGVYGRLDSRPWVRTALRSDGASLGSVFTRDSVSLPFMRLDPGSYTLRYTGLDPTGTSHVIVRWRNAWTWW